MKFSRGDSVLVRWDNAPAVRGTVTRVRKYKLRVLFPIRTFVWVPKGFCSREGRS